MKRSLASLFVLLAIVAAGAVLYEQVSFKRLGAQLEEQTGAIGEGYAALVTGSLLPLSDAYSLTASQRSIMERAESGIERLRGSETIEQVLESIGMLQTALAGFIGTVTTDQAFVRDERFIRLQQEMSERGDMRELLNAYNSTALRWNNGLQRTVGSVAAGLGKPSDNLLPYLRFDGSQEYVTIVEL